MSQEDITNMLPIMKLAVQETILQTSIAFNKPWLGMKAIVKNGKSEAKRALTSTGIIIKILTTTNED